MPCGWHRLGTLAVCAMRSTLTTCSPCSFDVVKDKLGGPRSTFPHDITIVAGTQAASAKSNYIALMRFSNVTQVSKHAVDYVLVTRAVLSWVNMALWLSGL